MWLATKFGFYSIVQTKNREDLFMVRARAEKDLLNLKEKILFLHNRKIKRTEDSDYMFRMFLDKPEVDILMIFMSNNIDYSNFKDEVHNIKNQRDKVPFYMRIWSVMMDYQTEKHGAPWVNYYKSRYAKNI